MKQMFKVLCAAALTGIVMGAGCMAGALATGVIVPRTDTRPRLELVESQIVELSDTLDAIRSQTIYDCIADRGGFDEMAGLE